MCTLSRANISFATYHVLNLDHKSVVDVHLPDGHDMLSDGIARKLTDTRSHREHLLSHRAYLISYYLEVISTELVICVEICGLFHDECAFSVDN